MTTPFPLGAYLGDPNADSVSGEASFEASYSSFVATMGTAPQYLDAYVDYTEPVSDWVNNASWAAWSSAESPDAKNLMPVIGLPMASTAAGSMTPDQQCQAFASGQYDSVLTGIVNAWAKEGFTNLVFRPGWEMNIPGPTYAGDSAQSQADWVAAFQHIYTVLHEAAAADGVTVQVVWNPSTTSYSNAEATTNLYPGNNYVDAIGADVYSNIYPYSDTSPTPTYHDWATGQEDSTVAEFIANPINREHYWTYPAATEWGLDSSGGHSQSLDSLIQFAEEQGKPFAIPETGAGNSDDGTDVTDDAAFPQWLSEQLTSAQASGLKIDFVNIWDSNGGGNYEFSYASDDKPLEAAAWAEYFGAETATGSPVLAAPTSETLSVGKATAIAGVSLSESGAITGETFTVTLTDTKGKLSATGTGVSGSGTIGLTLKGTLAQVNADLATVKDTEATAVSDKITLHATDSLGNIATAETISVAVNQSAKLTFVSGVGSDVMVAGAGRTDFTVGTGGLADTITIMKGHAGGLDILGDFRAGIDKIDLMGYKANAAKNAIDSQMSDGRGGTSMLLSDGAARFDMVGLTHVTNNIFR